ncbi:hypothetical protein GCM10009798_08760 [Nocardioides panacihumi]|uniref:Anti-sigma factor n=1 Tax=Nocardioides panacihumi TaxID=400774 RepID=A0ABN2QIW0_9ACTN
MPDTPDEELVRRLLADARHDEPVPADVVARLDGVLADLAAEGRPAEVTPLRRRHDPRRRRWAAGLVAAAVVVVGGVALRSVWPEGSGTSGSASSSADSAGSSSAGGRNQGPEAAPEGFAIVTPHVAELHRATLADDVRRAVAGLPVSLGSAPSSASPPASFTCADGGWGAGSGVPARLDGTDAMLVLRPPAGGEQVADVLQCGTGRVLASVTVPAR